jgi:hypothetical protein
VSRGRPKSLYLLLIGVALFLGAFRWLYPQVRGDGGGNAHGEETER